jgi:hypothetical protein
MSEEFADFAIWLALNSGNPSKASSTVKIENSSQIQLDYCVPQLWVKKRTDLTGVQETEGVHPDTGPAGGFVELQITINRGASSPVFLKTLLEFFGTQLTDSDFKRGRLGLENDDNPELDLVPVGTGADRIGYKLVQFALINPVDYKSKQIYRILLQFGGSVLNLPVFA